MEIGFYNELTCCTSQGLRKNLSTVDGFSSELRGKGFSQPDNKGIWEQNSAQKMTLHFQLSEPSPG